MLDWIICGLKVGSYCNASMLNDLPDLQDMHTFEGKTVRRFDADIDVGGTNASGYISATCSIAATKNIKKSQLRELLEDTSLFNTTKFPSLIYVEVGSKVCVCVVL